MYQKQRCMEFVDMDIYIYISWHISAHIVVSKDGRLEHQQHRPPYDDR